MSLKRILLISVKGIDLQARLMQYDVMNEPRVSYGNLLTFTNINC